LRKENQGCNLVKKQTTMALKRQVKTKERKTIKLDKHMESKRRISSNFESNRVQEKVMFKCILPLSNTKVRTLFENEVFIPDPGDCWI